MRAPYTQLYLHIVSATWDRLPLITPEIEPSLYAAMVAKCRDLKCETIAIGGIEDHVHFLARIPATMTVADFVKNIKGSSSHLITHRVDPRGSFKWQGAYGAFSISKGGVDRVAEYIRNQKIHHANRQLIEELERCEEDFAANKFAATQTKPPFGG